MMLQISGNGELSLLDLGRLPEQLLDDADVVTLIAPAALGVVFALLIWLPFSRLMTRWKAERLARIKKLETFTAVPTSSPYADPEARARREAELNVQARFSVMRVVLVLLLVGTVAILGTLPFLGKLPQTLLSFLLTVTIAIVGIAARPLIENFISGLVLSFSKQLKVGDTVLLDSEHYGTVEDINPTHTVVKLWDWRRYVIPNSNMLQKELVSYSHKDDYLWTHVPFYVTPRADIEEVERLAIEAAKASSHGAGFEEPQFWIREMLSGSTLCWVAAWAKKPEEAWYLRADIRKNLVKSLKKAGIDTQLQSHEVNSTASPLAQVRRGAGTG